jgi:SAM-dependent methyltransferase
MILRRLTTVIGLLVTCGACDRPKPTEATPAVSASAVPSATALDHAHPPIDCPLRKAGLDPAGLRPFEDVQKYIAFLEREDRALWQKPDDVVSALRLRGDETLVDLGAGSGYFAFRFAKALPRGQVVASDVEAEMVRHVHHKVMTEAVTNVRATLIEPAAPVVPDGTDVVFVCDVLHHVKDREGWLARIASQMKPGARLALIEFREGDLPEGPPAAAKIPRAELLRLATAAGFALAADHGELLPHQVFFEFKKP